MQWNSSICDWTQTLWCLQNIWTLHFKKTHVSKRIQSKSAECTLPNLLPRPFKKHIGLKKRGSFSGKISIHKNTHWRPLCLVVGRGHGSEQHLAVLPRLKEMLPLPMSQLRWKFQNQLVVNRSHAWDIQVYIYIYTMEWYVLKDIVCKSIFLLHSIILIYIIYPFGSHWNLMFLGDCFLASIALRMRSFLWGWRQKIRAGSFKPRDRKWRPTSLW